MEDVYLLSSTESIIPHSFSSMRGAFHCVNVRNILEMTRLRLIKIRSIYF